MIKTYTEVRMLTGEQTIAYADFFARAPGVLVFISWMSFLIEYLKIRGQQ